MRGRIDGVWILQKIQQYDVTSTWQEDLALLSLALHTLPLLSVLFTCDILRYNLSISACGYNTFDKLSTFYVFFELLTALLFPIPIKWIIPVSEYLSLNWGIKQTPGSIHFKWSLDLRNWQSNANIQDGHSFNNHTFCCFLRINWRRDNIEKLQ